MKTYDCTVVLGGQVLKIIGSDAIAKNTTDSTQKYADYLFFEDGAIAFPKLITDINNDDNSLSTLTEHLQKTEESAMVWNGNGFKRVVNQLSIDDNDSANYDIRKELININPSYDVDNRHLYSVSLNDIFPNANDLDWTHQSLRIMPYKFMYGCSHRCAFCKASGQSLVVKPVHQVIDELERYAIDEDIHYFRFFNSQINFSDKYVWEFCNELKKRNLDIMFNDSACFRHLTRETALMLREVGCVKLWFGLESPIPRVLKLVNKDLSMEEVHKGIQHAHDAGIWTGINLIVGFPHETDDEFNELCDFVIKYQGCRRLLGLQLTGGT